MGTCSHTTACRATKVKAGAADLSSDAMVAHVSPVADGSTVAEGGGDLLQPNNGVVYFKSSLILTNNMEVDARSCNDD